MLSFLLVLLTLSLLGLVAVGAYLEWRPLPRTASKRWWRGVVLGNLLLFIGVQLGLLLLGLQDALAGPVATDVVSADLSQNRALALFAVGMPTAVSTLAAAWAVGPIGAAALALIAEKPEAFGRSLVYLGLAEGIAIYGLVLSILMLDKI
jgi:V/A-type H+-transporting ATPase subunit K